MEALLDPSKINANIIGLPGTIDSMIRKVDVEKRATLYKNIVLAGDGCMYPKIAERLTHKMKGLAPPTMKFTVQNPPNRRALSWIGASNITAAGHLENFWIDRAEYKKSGPSVIHKKMFR